MLKCIKLSKLLKPDRGLRPLLATLANPLDIFKPARMFYLKCFFIFQYSVIILFLNFFFGCHGNFKTTNNIIKTCFYNRETKVACQTKKVKST